MTTLGDSPSRGAANLPVARAAADHPVARYEALVTALAAARRRHRVAATRTRKRHAVAVAAVRDEVVAARQAARRAGQERDTCARILSETDAAADATWRALQTFLGRRGRTLGPTPAPRPVPAAEVTKETPAALVARARHRLTLARTGDLPRPMPLPTGLVMPLCGVLGAVGLVAAAWCTIGLATDPPGTTALARRVLPLLSLFVAPFAGLPLSHWWLRWYGRRATPARTILTGLAGVATGAGMYLLWFR